jgi:sulfatase maturation enzyme AslB (radical SAM superfamily)
MDNLRTKFLNGEKPSECETCWVDESNGYKSKRQIYNEIYSSKNLDVTIETVNEYPIDYQIIISNACNLKCRSCGTSHSTQWQKEINNLENNIPGNNDYIHKIVMPYGQPGGNDSVFLKDLDEWGSKIKRLEVVGGEPFYIEKWKTIWEYLIEKGYSKNIDLAMSTNASIFNIELLENISKNFKSVGVGLSIDGMGKTYEYLRKNASWDVSIGNCLKYHQFYKENNYKGLGFNYTYTISWLNAMQLPDFHDWIKNNTPEFNIWNNIVHYPPHMSITTIPESEKKRIEEKWRQYDWGKYQNDIDSILSFMWSKNYTDDEIMRLYKNFIFFDAVRNESTFDVIKDDYPNMGKYFK